MPFVLLAAALLESYEDRGRPWRWGLAGAALAFAGLLRAPYVPAEAVLVGTILWRQGTARSAWSILAGAAIVLAGYILFEIHAGRMPFAWFAGALHQNLTMGRALHYGHEPVVWYLGALFSAWTVWAIPLLALAWLGARRYPALMAMAVTNFFVHSAIAHKEYRFIILSTMTVVVLAAIGSVDWMDRKPGGRRRTLIIGFWATAMIGDMLSPLHIPLWLKESPGIAAYRYMRAQPDLCGLAHARTTWSYGGGYTYLHRDVPIYEPDLSPDADGQLFAHQSAYNYILTRKKLKGPIPPAYHREACFTNHGLFSSKDLCVYHRDGPCDGHGSEALLVNPTLVREDM